MTEIRITVLVDNTVRKSGLIAEHGLSFLLETGEAKIVFDTGQGIALPHNTAAWDLRLDDIDAVVLSHGHYDHTGGLAYVLERAKMFGIKAVCFSKNELYQSTLITDLLKENRIDLIVLAGFLLLIPENLISLFQKKIINIHPALLPKYGGKGMYGMKVHKAVIENSESESGISIHYVNKKYDEGELIFQAKCKVESYDSPESLAEKIHKLEHEHYPKIIEEVLA